MEVAASKPSCAHKSCSQEISHQWMPPIWTLTAATLHPLERSPYEDNNTVRPYILNSCVLFKAWQTWLRARCAMRAAMTPSEFPKFSELPPELRIRIWKLALPASRIMKLSFKDRTHTYRSRSYHDRTTFGRDVAEPGSDFTALRTSMTNPVLLLVNAESRSLTLERFTLFKNVRHMDTRAAVYIDFQNDTVFLSHRTQIDLRAASLLRIPWRKQVQNLALTLNDLSTIDPFLKFFTALRELSMVTLDQPCKKGSSYEEGELRFDEIELDDGSCPTPGNCLNCKWERGISDIGDQEISYFKDKWDRKVMAECLSWNAPRLAFVTVENGLVATKTGLMRHPAPC